MATLATPMPRAPRPGNAPAGKSRGKGQLAADFVNLVSVGFTLLSLAYWSCH
jgi:hypothetical protein